MPSASSATSFDMRIHDYLAISPSWTLLGQDGTYKGVPDIGTSDAAHGLPGGPGHRDWRQAWGKVLQCAREVTVFSSSSAKILCAAYPDIAHRIAVRPHRLIQVPSPVQPGGRNIGVLGNINRAKGAHILQRLADQNLDRRLVVIGEMDGRFRLAAPHIVHGRFEGAEISNPSSPV